MLYAAHKAKSAHGHQRNQQSLIESHVNTWLLTVKALCRRTIQPLYLGVKRAVSLQSTGQGLDGEARRSSGFCWGKAMQEHQARGGGHWLFRAKSDSQKLKLFLVHGLIIHTQTVSGIEPEFHQGLQFPAPAYTDRAPARKDTASMGLLNSQPCTYSTPWRRR